MKKKKFLGLFGLFLLGVYFINLGITKASTDDITVTRGSSLSYISVLDDDSGEYEPATWGNINFGTLPLYCVDVDKLWPLNNQQYTKTSSSDDKGLVYILENGYNGINNKTIVDGGNKDRYITQGAVWLYKYGSLHNFNTAQDPDGLIPYMNQLAQEAREVQNGTRSYASTMSTSVTFNSAQTNMTLSDDKYVSEVITPTVTNATTYDVSISGVTGAKVTDTNGTEMTTFANGSGFVVSVPSSSISEAANLTVTVSASGTVSYINIYTSNTNPETYQSILMVDTKESSVSESLVLAINPPVVKTYCVDYTIVGDTIPDASLTDPTPSDEYCYFSDHEYTQEPVLTTQTNCTFSGWHLTDTLTGQWVDGTPLNDETINDVQNGYLHLYGAWDCPSVDVPQTAAGTALIILGIGLVSVSLGTMLYVLKINVRPKKI